MSPERKRTLPAAARGPTTETNGSGPDEPAPTTWRPIDLTDAIVGKGVEPPTTLRRSDGLALLYGGRVHSFQGESESLKSWAAQVATAEVLEAGGDVIYVDYEDDENGVVSRLLALSASPEAIKAHLAYIRPDEPLLDRQHRPTQGLVDLTTVLDNGERMFGLAVVDGVTEAMTTEGLDLLSNADIAYWMRRLPRRLARTGAPTVVVDHLPKDRGNQGRGAIGGQHKLAGLTGAAYKFVLVKPLARPRDTTPVEGLVAITVEKDRPGYVRGEADDGKVATLVLTAYPDGGISPVLDTPAQRPTVDQRIVDRVLGHLAVYDGSSGSRVETGVGGDNKKVREAAAWAISNGLVEVRHVGQTHQHWLTDAGRSRATADEAPDEPF